MSRSRKSLFKISVRNWRSFAGRSKLDKSRFNMVMLTMPMQHQVIVVESTDCNGQTALTESNISPLSLIHI